MTTPNAGKDTEKLHHTYIASCMKWYGYSGEWFGSFFFKLNLPLPHDPAILPLGIYPREMKTYVHTKT